MRRLRIQYNAPVVLTFFLLSLGVLALDGATAGWTTSHLFCVYRSSLKDPLFYIRLFGHVLGHADLSHFLNNMLFKRFSESRMRLMGHLLKDSMKLERNSQVSCMVLSLEEKKKFGIQDGDTEGFVNLPLMIKGVEVSALFSESEDFIKVSLRSKGSFSVNALAKSYFNGGGHERAAGGRLYIPIGQVRDYFSESLEQFLLNNRRV